MNKKLLALAVGAALTVPVAASADVKWYGQLQIEISGESATTTGGTTTDGRVVQGGASRFYDGTTVEDNKRGRLGVVATEKLGNGMTAIAKFEWQVNTAAANVSDGNREAYVGLKGNFGTIQVGALKSPYKYTGGVKYDPFVTTNLEARRFGGMSTGNYGHNGFLSKAVGYMTPKVNGFSAWAVGIADDTSGTGGAYSLSAMYKGGNFEAFVAYANDDVDTNTFEATKVGGMYKMGAHKFKIQYEMLDKVKPSASIGDGTILFLGYEGKFGNNVLVAQYGDGKAEGTTLDQKSTYYALGVIHKMSKQTRVFAGYAKTDVENTNATTGDSDRDAFSVGLRKDF